MSRPTEQSKTYIRFVESPNHRDAKPRRKTKIWEVRTLDGDNFLGEIMWYNGWRRYAFFPSLHTIYEPKCLRDLANFCEAQTNARKAARRNEKILESVNPDAILVFQAQKAGGQGARFGCRCGSYMCPGDC